MLNIVVYIFICFWTLLAIIGMVSPKKLLTIFRSLSELFSVDPDDIPKGVLVLCRFFSIVFLLFGLFIIYQGFVNQVRF